MANDKSFKIKNGILAQRYLQSAGAETAGSVGYNLAAASYDSVSLDVSSQDIVPLGISFGDAGLKLYVAGAANDTIFQYTLSTAFDLSTASYDSKSFSVVSQDNTPTGLAFNNTGSKMFVVGTQNDSVYQYSLSAAWDVSTASYDSVSLNVSPQDTGPTDITFKPDGTKMYVSGDVNDSVYEYTLSTPFDINTAYFTSSLSVQGADGGLAFNSDGTKLFIVSNATSIVYEYALTNAYDVTTGSYTNISFSVLSEGGNSTSMAFNLNGSKMYISNFSNDTVYQYSTASLTQTLDLSTGTYFSFTPSGATTVSFTNPPASGLAIGFSVEIIGDGSAITWPASVKWHEATTPTATATKEIYVFITTDGGTTYYGKKAAEGLSS